jgi:hypothetical protein
MSYLKLSTMQYPLYEGDIRLEYPEITEDQTGATFPLPDDYVLVEQTTPPSFDRATQYVKQLAPIQVNGVWQSEWEVKDYTATQIANRNKRAAQNA